MPLPLMKKIHREDNIPMDVLEKLWAQAKAIAASEGQAEHWGLITTIFEKNVKKYKNKHLKEHKKQNESFLHIFQSMSETREE
jgi:hypothetical protein